MLVRRICRRRAASLQRPGDGVLPVGVRPAMDVHLPCELRAAVASRDESALRGSWLVARGSSVTPRRFASIARTMHWLPNRSADRRINSGSWTAAVLGPLSRRL